MRRGLNSLAIHPAQHLAGYAGILQADAYAGFGELHDGKRKPGPITEAACWSHGRRHFFELADLRKAPLAVEAVRRIDEIFAIEPDGLDYTRADGRNYPEGLCTKVRSGTSRYCGALS